MPKNAKGKWRPIVSVTPKINKALKYPLKLENLLLEKALIYPYGLIAFAVMEKVRHEQCPSYLTSQCYFIILIIKIYNKNE
ncbi:MAG: hypothetical protein ABIN61_02295 [candidate division WOR-3 bacterium]